MARVTFHLQNNFNKIENLYTGKTKCNVKFETFNQCQ